MYPLGHVGTVLVLFAPIAYVLHATEREAALAPGLGVALVLTQVPDVDLYVGTFVHRGLTHTVLAAGVLGAVGALLWLACRFDGPFDRRERAGYGFLVGVVSGLAHLLGDVITPMGIQPFLPWNPTVYTLSLTYARDPLANLALFGVGVALLSTGVNLATRLPDAGEEVPDEATVDSHVHSD